MLITKSHPKSKGLFLPTSYNHQKHTIAQLKRLEKKLKEEFKKHPGAVAIASNQVAFNTNGEAPAAFLYKDKVYFFPTYATVYGPCSVNSAESCLSNKGFVQVVRRFLLIDFTYYCISEGKLKGPITVKNVEYFNAIAIQHEIDHLQGKPIFEAD